MTTHDWQQLNEHASSYRSCSSARWPDSCVNSASVAYRSSRDRVSICKNLRSSRRCVSVCLYLRCLGLIDTTVALGVVRELIKVTLLFFLIRHGGGCE